MSLFGGFFGLGLVNCCRLEVAVRQHGLGTRMAVAFVLWLELVGVACLSILSRIPKTGRVASLPKFAR